MANVNDSIVSPSTVETTTLQGTTANSSNITGASPWTTTITPFQSSIVPSSKGTPSLGNSTVTCEGFTFFGECIAEGQEYFSFILGLVAAVIWLIANYRFLVVRRKHGHLLTGPTIYLLHVLTADSLNLLGALLCDQLGTQILTAIILVLCDVVFLVVLTVSFHRQRAAAKTGEILNSHNVYIHADNWNAKHATKPESNGSMLPVCCLVLPWMVSLLIQPDVPFGFGSGVNGGQPSVGRKLLMVTDSGADNFGFATGVFAALLYTTLRITTIKDSIYKKETIHQELSFHVLAAAASCTYCASIVSYSMESAYLINSLPWLCGIALLGLEDFLIIFLTWQFSRSVSRAPRVKPRVEDGTMLLHGDGSSVNLEVDDRPVPAPTQKGSPYKSRNKPYLEVAEKPRSNTMDTDVSYIIDKDMGATASADLANQREVQVQVISHSNLPGKTSGPEEDLFMNRENLRPRNRDFEDEFEWDFSDMGQKYGDPEREWDEEKVLKEIEEELKKADDEDGASTPSLSYDGQQEMDDGDMYNVNI